MRSRTFMVYPRPDQEYKKKESLDFQMERSAKYLERPTGQLLEVYSWLTYAIVGIVTGLAIFIFEITMDYTIKLKWLATQAVLDDGSLGMGYVVFLAFSAFYGLLAVGMTVYG